MPIFIYAALFISAFLQPVIALCHAGAMHYYVINAVIVDIGINTIITITIIAVVLAAAGTEADYILLLYYAKREKDT